MFTYDVKILTAQISEEIYYLVVSHRVFTAKQKGCHKRTRETGDLLYIDQHVLKEAKVRQKNVTTGWINPKMTYDMVPQTV